MLSCSLAAGAGDGFSQLVVKTRNMSGIAAGSPILLNHGMDCDHGAVAQVLSDDAAQPQKIRTMLGPTSRCSASARLRKPRRSPVC